MRVGDDQRSAALPGRLGPRTGQVEAVETTGIGEGRSAQHLQAARPRQCCGERPHQRARQRGARFEVIAGIDADRASAWALRSARGA